MEGLREQHCAGGPGGAEARQQGARCEEETKIPGSEHGQQEENFGSWGRDMGGTAWEGLRDQVEALSLVQGSRGSDTGGCVFSETSLW